MSQSHTIKNIKHNTGNKAGNEWSGQKSARGYVEKEKALADMIRKSFNEERGAEPSFQGRRRACCQGSG